MDPQNLVQGNQYTIDGTIYYYRGKQQTFINTREEEAYVFVSYNDPNSIKIYGDTELQYVEEA
jgi:hypothetical protein